MAEIEEECTFHTKADQIKFHTQTNGDSLYMKSLKLTQAQATSLAWLVNSRGTELEFQIKVKA